MGLFKADFYRSFAVGFVLGAIALAGVMGTGNTLTGSVMPQAFAASVSAE